MHPEDWLTVTVLLLLMAALVYAVVTSVMAW